MFAHEAALLLMPMEMQELALMKTFVQLFDGVYKSHYMTHEATPQAYTTLATVCYNWWQTMNGWPQSPTKHWFKHKLRQAVDFVCRRYTVPPRLHSSLSVFRGVCGVTQCDNQLFVACAQSDRIHVFRSDNNEQLADVKLPALIDPSDLAACVETKQLYVADRSARCVWRVSLDDPQVVTKWLPNNTTTSAAEFQPRTLSVTSRRLLVTSLQDKVLLQYGADGVELKRVALADTDDVRSAVETSRGTFIVSQVLPEPKISEISAEGHVMRVYSDHEQLAWPCHVTLDPDGRLFVADSTKHCVLLLNCRLELERVLLQVDEHQLAMYPQRLCYTEQASQLLVGSVFNCVQLFSLR